MTHIGHLVAMPAHDLPGSVLSEDWIAFRRVFGARLSIHDAVAVARRMRAALQHYAMEPLPEILSGHQPNGKPSRDPHVVIAGLPTSGNPSPELAGVAVIIPRTTPTERRHVVQAVSAWEAAARRDGEQTPTLSLRLGALGVLALERVASDRPMQSLQSASWCRAASRWVSVTPIVLDRFPGKLGSRDPLVAARATAEAERIIARSCRYIGLPAPARVELVADSALRGMLPAREFPPYPGIPGRQKRYSVHAMLRFAEPVRGPMLLGAGRHEGMGLMRPQ